MGLRFVKQNPFIWNFNKINSKIHGNVGDFVILSNST